MEYSEVKQLARERGMKIQELLALAPQNDPFYVGQDSQMTAARWFAGWWQRLGFRDGVHLRRMHYALVSQEPGAEKPDGTVYENTEGDWNYLGKAAKWARYLGLVDPAAFVDRRNPEAVVNYWSAWEDNDPDYDVQPTWDWEHQVPAMPEIPALNDLPEEPGYEARGFRPTQPFLVELWCEKSTMNDVLIPLCRRYDVNLVTGLGELSITTVCEFMKRVRESGKPARILYISDYDPAGLGMPISVARKIEFFIRNGNEDLDIRLQPVVLTAEQVAEYNLPRVPVKDSDRRKANFEAIHGEGQVELDALEALYPGHLAQILRAEILNYYDEGLEQRAREAQQEFEDRLAEVREEVLRDYEFERERLRANYERLVGDWNKTRQAFADLVAPFQAQLEQYAEVMAELDEEGRDLEYRICEGLRGAYVERPEPVAVELPDESNNKLYDSARNYMEQMQVYKEHRGLANGEDEE